MSLELVKFKDICYRMRVSGAITNSTEGLYVRLFNDECPRCEKKGFYVGRGFKDREMHPLDRIIFCPHCKERQKTTIDKTYHKDKQPEELLPKIKREIQSDSRLLQLFQKTTTCPECGEQCYSCTDKVKDEGTRTWKVCKNKECTWMGNYELKNKKEVLIPQ